MSVVVRLPELGESVVEGTVARWLVKQGESVTVDQPLVEVTTDKVDAEIPSPVAGVVEKLLVAEGETIPVGTELVRIVEGASASVAQAAPAAGPAADSPPAAATATAGAGAEGATPGAGSPLATPTARRVADSAGVDLGAVRGSGAGGRITKDDVVGHVARSPAPASPQHRLPRPARPRPLRRARHRLGGHALPPWRRAPMA